MAHGCSGSGEAGLLGRRRHLLSGTPSSTRFSLPLLLSGAPRDAIQKMSHSSPPLDLIGTKFYDQYFKKEKKNQREIVSSIGKLKKNIFQVCKISFENWSILRSHPTILRRTHLPHLETAWLRKSTLSSLRGPFPGRSQQRGGGHASLTRRLPSTPRPWRAPGGCELNGPRKILRAKPTWNIAPGGRLAD